MVFGTVYTVKMRRVSGHVSNLLTTAFSINQEEDDVNAEILPRPGGHVNLVQPTVNDIVADVTAIGERNFMGVYNDSWHAMLMGPRGGQSLEIPVALLISKDAMNKTVNILLFLRQVETLRNPMSHSHFQSFQ